MSKKPNAPRVAENEARAFVKHLRVSPRKLNLVAQMIRGMAAEDALVALSFSRKRISNDVKKPCLAQSLMPKTTTSLMSTG